MKCELLRLLEFLIQYAKLRLHVVEYRCLVASFARPTCFTQNTENNCALFEAENSLKWTARTALEGVCLRESSLYFLRFLQVIEFEEKRRSEAQKT